MMCFWWLKLRGRLVDVWFQKCVYIYNILCTTLCMVIFVFIFHMSYSIFFDMNSYIISVIRIFKYAHIYIAYDAYTYVYIYIHVLFDMDMCIYIYMHLGIVVDDHEILLLRASCWQLFLRANIRERKPIPNAPCMEYIPIHEWLMFMVFM